MMLPVQTVARVTLPWLLTAQWPASLREIREE